MKDLKDAVEAYTAGENPVEIGPVKGAKGRPAIKYRLGGIILNKKELQFVEKVCETAKNSVQAQEIMNNVRSLSEGEFSELCRLAVPQLMDRAIKLAMLSDDPKEIMAVAKEITERGYGKVEKKHDTEAIPSDHIRRAWTDAPKITGLGVINAITVDKEENV